MQIRWKAFWKNKSDDEMRDVCRRVCAEWANIDGSKVDFKRCDAEIDSWVPQFDFWSLKEWKEVEETKRG